MICLRGGSCGAWMLECVDADVYVCLCVDAGVSGLVCVNGCLVCMKMFVESCSLSVLADG